MNGGNEFHGHHGPDHVAPMNRPSDRMSTTDDSRPGSAWMDMLIELEHRASARPGINREFRNGFVGSLAALLADSPEGRATWQQALDSTTARIEASA